MEPAGTRRLRAVLVSDIVGYSRLMEVDEAGTWMRVRTLHRDIVDPAIVKRDGKIVKSTGDGVLAQFQSVADAVECAKIIQSDLKLISQAEDDQRAIRLRLGIDVGDVITDDGDIYGETVIIASRLQELSPAGGLCLSRRAYEHLGNRSDLPVVDIGECQVKNLDRAIPALIWRPGSYGEPARSQVVIPDSIKMPRTTGNGIPLTARSGSLTAAGWDDIIKHLPTFASAAVVIRHVRTHRGKWVALAGESRISTPLDATASGAGAGLRKGDYFYIEIDCNRATFEAALTTPAKVVALLEADQVSAQCLWRAGSVDPAESDQIRIPHSRGGDIVPLKQETAGYQEYYLIVHSLPVPPRVDRKLEEFVAVGGVPRGKLDEIAGALQQVPGSQWRVLCKRLLVRE